MVTEQTAFVGDVTEAEVNLLVHVFPDARLIDADCWTRHRYRFEDESRCADGYTGTKYVGQIDEMVELVIHIPD